MTKDEREKLKKEAEACKRRIDQIQEKLNDPEEVGWPCELDEHGSNEIYIPRGDPSYTINASSVITIYVIANDASDREELDKIARLVRLVPIMVDLMTRHNLIHLLPE